MTMDKSLKVRLGLTLRQERARIAPSESSD